MSNDTGVIPTAEKTKFEADELSSEQASMFYKALNGQIKQMDVKEVDGTCELWYAEVRVATVHTTKPEALALLAGTLRILHSIDVATLT